MDMHIDVPSLPNTMGVLEVFSYLVPWARSATSLNQLVHRALKIQIVLHSDIASDGVPLVAGSFVDALTKDLEFCRI